LFQKKLVDSVDGDELAKKSGTVLQSVILVENTDLRSNPDRGGMGGAEANAEKEVSFGVWSFFFFLTVGVYFLLLFLKVCWVASWMKQGNNF
jgi:hypothetical protein